MKKRNLIQSRRGLFAVGILVAAVAAILPATVIAASAGGVTIKVKAVNMVTSDDDVGSVGDKLTLKVSDPSGTTFRTLTGKAKFTSSTGTIETFNIDGSTPSEAYDLGMIELTDSSRPGDQIFIGLAGTLEVRVHFAGGTGAPIRFSSGLDDLGVKIRIK